MTTNPGPANDPSPQRFDELDKALLALERLTQRLRLLTWSIALLTMCNLVTFSLLVLVRQQHAAAQEGRTYKYPFPTLEWTAAALTLLVISITVILYYDQMRRRGDTLFEEIADEIEWYTKAQTAEWESMANAPAPLRRGPSLRIRLVLREYSRSADLPIIQGKYGPAIYTLTNMLATIGMVIYVNLANNIYGF